MHQIMAAVLWILKFVKFGKKLQKNKFSKSVAVAAIWSPPGWSFCAPNYGRCLVDFEIRQQFKKVAKKQIFKICSRSWHLVTSGAVISWSQKSTLPPRTRDLRSSEIAFIDVGSRRMSAQSVPGWANTLCAQCAHGVSWFSGWDYWIIGWLGLI